MLSFKMNIDLYAWSYPLLRINPASERDGKNCAEFGIRYKETAEIT